MSEEDFSNGYKAIQDFVLSEMQQRDMSAREFAAFVGVAATTINKCVNGDSGNPSVEFLLKLSRATKVDICTLMALISPENVPVRRPSPQAIILAERFASLPDDVQEVIAKLVFKRL